MNNPGPASFKDGKLENKQLLSSPVMNEEMKQRNAALNLQMPDHRTPVPANAAVTGDDRPESKKGFLNNALNQPDTSSGGTRGASNNMGAYEEEMGYMDDDEIEEPQAFEEEPHFGPGNFSTL